MKSALALTWFAHRRTTELCVGLDLDCVVLASRRRGALRYLELFGRTLTLLAGRRPKVLLVQNPSLVLAACAVVLRSILGYRLIADAHNEAVEPVVNPQRWVLRLTHWVLRKSDLTIVTNEPLATVVTRVGGHPFVLPDRIPTPPEVKGRALGTGFNVVLISTYAVDEPIAEVIEAVRGLDMTLYVTGNDKKLAAEVKSTLPPNVLLTGFLSEHDYWETLAAADAIVDLTTMDNCLVCGAYEAVALGKPVMLSGNQASRQLFRNAAVYTDNSMDDIRSGLLQLREKHRELSAASLDVRRAMIQEWSSQARALIGTMQSLERSQAPSAIG